MAQRYPENPSHRKGRRSAKWALFNSLLDLRLDGVSHTQGGGPVAERVHKGRGLGYPSIYELNEQEGRLMVGARKAIAYRLRRAVSQ